MFKNYFKIALRIIRQHKEYSFINIAGLALGIACCLLILVWVQDELSFDKFNKESVFKPKECTRCEHVNQATNRFCARCGFPLDEESKTDLLKKSLEREEADNIMDTLMKD
jgi:ribosomal protein L37E